MKKLVLLALLMITAPALATVTIDANDQGDGVVNIEYTVTGETELVRAFALDITVTGANIIDINDYFVGECNSTAQGFGIFPGSIAISGAGVVTSYGNPVAPAGDPNAAGAIPGPAITIEVGSLYDPNKKGTDAPGNTGVLCSITIDCENADNPTVSITENGKRGGTVMEDANAPSSVVLAKDVPIECGDKICIPDDVDHAQQYADYFAYLDANSNANMEGCWCAAYQCDGDADLTTQGLLQYRVYTDDLGLVITNWKKTISTADPCADVDHKAQGLLQYRVYTDDLGVVITNWKKTSGELPGDCPRPDAQM